MISFLNISFTHIIIILQNLPCGKPQGILKLKQNSINITFEDSLLFLDYFYEIYHTDIFAYHSSTIAEFLNNIRWGIHEYLFPEFCQSIVFEGNIHPQKYHYTYPIDLKNNFARECYWDLMNKIRSKPYIRKFKVTRYLKMNY